MFSCYIKNEIKAIKKTIVPCISFSVFFLLTIIVGHSLYNYNKLSDFAFKWVYFGGVVLLTIFSSMVIKLLNFLESKTSYLWLIYRYPWLWEILFFLCWLPCYLSYYPGIVSYDMESQLPQILGTANYNKYHPPLHTFGYQLCHMLGNFTGISGIVIYSICQMCLLACAFAHLIRLFIKLEINNWIILVSIVFFCLNPVIAIFSFIPTKDISFTIFLVLYSVELCLFFRQKEGYARNFFAMFRLVSLGVLCCLFRNNMIYAILLSIIISIFLLRKNLKHLLISNVCIIGVYILINGSFYSALGIEDGNPREMLSVPLQQIAYVMVHCDIALSKEELETLNRYVPVEELENLYNPRFADPVKNVFNSEEFIEDKVSFFNLWFKLLKEYPKEYITAFLDLNLPYWYIDAKSIDPYANRIYIETFIYSPEVTNYNVVRESKIPWLYAKYEVFADFGTIQKIPVISHIFSISLPFWVLLFTCVVLSAKRKVQCIYIIIPHICYWFTFLLGPVSNLRYVFPLITLYPMCLALIVDTKCFLQVEECRNALNKGKENTA